ncbi:hypothetical protein NFJ02_15g19890 [Pycnococcus provasolii]
MADDESNTEEYEDDEEYEEYESITGHLSKNYCHTYAPFFVHPQTAHVTLGVIGLYDDASIDAACMRMEQEVTNLKLGAPKLVVGEHVGGFRKQVLYLRFGSGTRDASAFASVVSL